MRGHQIGCTAGRVEGLLSEHASEDAKAVAVLVAVLVEDQEGGPWLYHAETPGPGAPQLLRQWANLVGMGPEGDMRLKPQADGGRP